MSKLPKTGRTPKAPAARRIFSPEEDADFATALAILRYGFGMMEIEGWGLSREQSRLAIRSEVYKELMRPLGTDPDGADALHSLSCLWQAARSPADKEPRGWMAEWRAEWGEAVIVDRGEAGLFTDWCSAVWYAQFMDPESISIDEALSLAC